jgi:hypothetical protein
MDNDLGNLLEDEPLETNKEAETTNFTKLESSPTSFKLRKEWNFSKNHPKQQIISDFEQGTQTKVVIRNEVNNMALLSQPEPKKLKKLLLMKTG